jgi:replicative DNA helicase
MTTKLKKKHRWSNQRQAFQDALIYIDGRRKGKIRSLQTPWAKVNDAGVDGLEWNSMLVLGGRPGTGKTTIKSQITREAFKLNPGENIRVLEFQFEMMARVQAVREFSNVTGLSYKDVCSAGRDSSKKLVTLTDAQLQQCHDYAKKKVKDPVDIVETPLTTEEFKKTIREYMEAYAVKEQATDKNGNPYVKKTYQKTIITLDHSYLVKKAKNEGSKTDMLYNLGEACTELKRQYPIIFIILSQLKRETDRPERNEDGKYGNYILESDILGGDALTQHADMIIGINRPAKRHIKFYGPDRYIIQDDDTLVFHFLKCRNGDVRMSFFKAEYHRMAVTEVATPGTQQQKISTKF